MVKQEYGQKRKWRDKDGNVYGIEQAVRNGRFVVIRTNEGGNRKAAKQFRATVGSPAAVQRALDEAAVANGWTEVAE